MSNNKMEGETTPGLVQDRYCCTECRSFIEIILLDENNNEIEFRCLNPNNLHRKKMKINEYLNKINKITEFKNFSDKYKEHDNQFQCFCFDCNLNLCKECLETRNHIFHKKY